MRRHLITKEFEQEVVDFCNSLFINRGALFETPAKKLRKLRSGYSLNGDTSKRKYIRKILEIKDELLTAKPENFDNYFNIFEGIIPSNQFEKGFADSIKDALRFDELRDTYYPRFIKKYNIRTCVYCNALLTIVIDIKGDEPNVERKNQFELDHSLPSSKYPYLSTSFYNLYPSCGNCNRSKNSQEAHFKFYTSDPTVWKFLNSN